jgi:hypothetical protein
VEHHLLDPHLLSQPTRHRYRFASESSFLSPYSK